MIHRFAVAIGAGCAAAFLFAVSAQTSPLAMTLAYLAPLPIMIATMGWGVGAGTAAAATSVAGLTLLAEPLTGLLYAASVAVPAWMLAACAAAPVARYLPARSPSAQPYASVGSIVTLAAAIGMVGAGAVLTAIIVLYGGYANGAKQVATALAALAGDAFDANDGVEARVFAETIVRFGPAAIAASTLLMLSVNLYAAARSTQLSHRLQRPWSDLPTSLRLPWPLGVLAIGCAACAYALPPPASQYFSIGVGGLGAAFAMQGLAVAHALSRGLKLRVVMLVALYACCVLRAKYTLPFLAALGLIDAFARLRARPAFLPSPKPSSHR
ncbi:MAG TPA: DUF2232 domain-containing protein [Roseiarcus sp.]|nr:DUF2232 domain-containing protein [Roseiarcus sp.]